MFARKLRVEVDGKAAPQEWLEQYFMRNFVGLSAFDETLVTGDGELEAGLGVAVETVREELEKWWRGRKMIGQGGRVEVTER